MACGSQCNLRLLLRYSQKWIVTYLSFDAKKTIVSLKTGSNDLIAFRPCILLTHQGNRIQGMLRKKLNDMVKRYN